MNRIHSLATTVTSAFIASTCVLATATPAWAVKPEIIIPLGQTTLLTIPEGVDRLVVGDTSIADVVVLPGQTRDILINARKPGFTNFLVWPTRGTVKNYKLEVLSSSRDETIAVRIQVLEVTERKGGHVGVRWSDAVGITEAAPGAPFRFGLPVRNDLITATLNTLAQDRDIKVLAQPTLVIQNGKKGTFMAGGELPIPLIQATAGGSAYTIEWKPFGVKMEVEPRLEGNNTITMKLKPEVSSVDTENAIQLKDISVPAIATRSVETSVQVQNNESIVIAGLLRTERVRSTNKLPFLGDIPLIGYLFGSVQYDERASELVFIVTPTVVINNGVSPESDYGKGRPAQPKK